MNTAENLKTIYEEAAKKLGPKQARKYLTTFFSNMIYDLESNSEVTTKNLEHKIQEEVAFILKADKQGAA